MKVIQLQGQLGLSDVARFLYFHTLRRTWPIYLILGLAFLLFLPVWILTPDDRSRQSSMPLLLILGFWLLLVVVLPYFSAWRQMKQSVLLKEPFEITFRPDGYSSKYASGSSEMKWAVVHTVRETKGLFLLYYSSRAATMIPKRFFADAAQMTAWRELVSAAIAPKKIVAPGLIARWF